MKIVVGVGGDGIDGRSWVLLVSVVLVECFVFGVDGAAVMGNGSDENALPDHTSYLSYDDVSNS